MQLVLLLLMIIYVVQNENVSDTKTRFPIDEIDLAFDEFPTLEQVIPTLGQKTGMDFGDIPNTIVKNISIDIDKINLEKFKKKMEIIIDKLGVDEPKNETRRQAIILKNHRDEVYWAATGQLMKRKTVDLMLQTLYMARHKVKVLEGSKYFTKKDTGFRIAFTYRRLGRLCRKIMQIYTYANRYRFYWHLPDPQIVLHAKAARLHVDFVYLWWVLIKVDAKYQTRQKEEKIKREKKQNAGLPSDSKEQ